MSRLILKASDLVDLFGRQLPSPTIENIKLNSITLDDPIYAELDASIDSAIDAGGRLPSEAGEPMLSPPAMGASELRIARIGTIPQAVVKMEIFTAIHINTSDGFDPASLSKELFQLSTSTDLTDNESLYINIVVAKDSGVIEDLKKSNSASRCPFRR